MDDLKLQLQKQLVANVIRDKCSENSNIIFNEAWCEQDRIIRFTTPFFRALFRATDNNKGNWKTGDTAMYEVCITPNSLSVACIVCEKIAIKKDKSIIEALSGVVDGIGKRSVLRRIPATHTRRAQRRIFVKLHIFLPIKLSIPTIILFFVDISGKLLTYVIQYMHSIKRRFFL